MDGQAITVATLVRVPLERAWQVFTQPDHITQWYFAANDWECPTARNDLRVGGEFAFRMQAKDGSVGFDFAGTYQYVKPLRYLGFTIGDRKVNVSFDEVSDVQTRVTEVFEPEDQNSADMQRAGWLAILENFKRHAESL